MKKLTTLTFALIAALTALCATNTFETIDLNTEVFDDDDQLGVAALRNVTSLTNAFQSKVDENTGARTTTIIGDNITATGKVMKITDNLVVGEGVNYSDHAFLTGHKAKASYGDLTAGAMGYVVIGVNPGGVAHTLKLDGDLSGIDLTKKYSLALSHFQISNQIEISNVVGQVVYLKKAYWGSDFASELADKGESYFWNMYNGDDDNGLYCPTDTSIGNTKMRNFKYQTAEGGSSKAIGKYSHAEGRYSIAEGRYSHAEGQLGFAGGVASHVEGQGGLVTGSCGHSEGINTEATSYAHAEGAFTKAVGNGSHAEGGWRASATEYAPGGQALASASHAEGVGTTAKGTGSHAEGYGNVANGVYSHAEGGYYSTSEVHTNIANGAASHVEGMETYTSTSASCGHAEGYRSHSEGKYTHAEGQSTIAKGIASHAEGQSTQSNGTGSHAEGRGNVASGSYSHVEGGMVFDGVSYTNVASQTASHAEGYSTTASSLGCHAEGYGTIASANRAHAEGHTTLAVGDSAHAEGHLTIAYGGYSHAEGNGTSSDKDFMMFHIGGNSYTTTVNHALSPNTILRMRNQIRKVTATPGARTITLNSVFSDLTTNDVIKVVTGVAYGEYSHAEGYGTLSIGNYSHTEGSSTKALGQSAHASGEYSEANKQASFASGYRAIANNQIGEIALGKNNISSANTMLSVGIGTDAQKQNAFEIKTTGDVFIKGIGNYDGINQSGAISLQAKIQALESAGGLDAATIKSAASTAKGKIEAANDLSIIKAAMIEFLDTFNQ